MMWIRKKEAQWLGECIGIPDDWQARGVSIHSRNIQPGNVFYALRGEHTDGHQYIADAWAHGAAACVVSRDWYQSQPVSPNGRWIVVEDTLTALQRLARYYREQLDLSVIAVAGSNGKTTSKEMLQAVLATTFNVQATAGNLNTEIGVPLTLLSLHDDRQIAVIEMGATAKNDIRLLCDIAKPDSGFVTNIGKDHLLTFGDYETVLLTNKELYDYLQSDGVRFVNTDLSYFSDQFEQPQGLIGYGTSTAARYRYRIIGQDALARAEMEFIPPDGERFTVRLAVSGLHFVPHAAAAFAVAETLGVLRADFAEALSEFKPLENRFGVRSVRGFTLIDDTYNANPDSMQSALETLQMMKTVGKKIAVLGDMLELGQYSEEEHRRVGEIISRSGVDICFTFGTEMYQAYSCAQVPLKKHFEQKKDLIDLLFQLITPGDLILVKGSRGMQMDEVVEALSI